MEKKIFWWTFSKRTAICFTVMLFMFFSCILRVAVAATTNYEEIRKERNSYKITIGKVRGTIYDHNKVPITNNKRKKIAAVSPTEKAISAIKSSLKEEEFNEISEDLYNGKPVICEINKDIECDGITTSYIYENSDNIPSIHIIGYTDGENKGINGIEKAYNDILYSDKEVKAYFESDGLGNILEGSEPIIDDYTSIIANGVVTTLDINIQNIAQKAALNIEKGAVVVAEAKTGKIRASVSMPHFNSEKIENYLKDDTSPLLNRAINAYNVGSIFKPCVAIAGIENAVSNYYYFCSGKEKIADRFFNCHKRDGHKFMTINTALANSCNTFFYNYAKKIGGDKIYNTASALNFGNDFNICKGITVNSGTIPNKEMLKNSGHLANFSIGQGKITLSPISMLTLYCSIASDGAYYLPSIVEGTLTDGKFEEYDIGKRTRVMTESTSKILREYLKSVIEIGTGKDAKPKMVSAGGKTATAQTGVFKNGEEISQGWFCGFFPNEEPEYVVIIFSEDIKKQSKTCNQLFSIIADEITSLNN